MANQFLSLSLFLMLLSFFVIMNGMSNFEESKSAPVMNSIALAFSNQISEESHAPSVVSSPNASIREGDTLEVLDGLFNAHLSSFESSRNRLGTVMHVQTSVGQFQNAIDIIDADSTGLDGKGSFLLTMVTLLRSEKKGMPYRMDMVLNTPEDPSKFQKQSPDEFLESLRRVSSFSNSLEKAGLPKKMISAGLAKGEIGFIDLYFYRYKPFNPLDAMGSKGGEL